MHTASEQAHQQHQWGSKLGKFVPKTQTIEEHNLTFDIARKYQCFNCKEIVSIEDKFNDNHEE